MIWDFVLMLAGIAGAAVLGWYAHGWHCQRTNPSCPVWQQECKLSLIHI